MCVCVCLSAGSENLIELDVKALVSVIVSNILVTVLIGWAVYSICAQPPTRSSYQGNKGASRSQSISVNQESLLHLSVFLSSASDRQALISNHTPSGGETYQVHRARNTYTYIRDPGAQNQPRVELN